MRPIAVVQHEPSVPPGLIAEVLEESEVPYRVVEAWRDPEWPVARDLGGLVVLGGTMNVDELDAYPFLRAGRDLMSDALDQDTPVMGVCLGSQMMARVLGGDVFRAEPRNAFFSPVVVAEDPVVKPFGSCGPAEAAPLGSCGPAEAAPLGSCGPAEAAPRGSAPVLQFHEDTFSLPDGAEALARSARSGLLQAFRYGGRAYAVQFHFEVDAAILEGWCRNIGERAMAEEWGISTAELLAQGERHLEAQRRAGRELFTRFLDLARETAGPEGPAAEPLVTE